MTGDGSDCCCANQQVYSLPGKFLRKNEEPLILLRRKTHFQSEVLTFHIADIMQPLAECRQIDCFLFSICTVPQNANSVHLFQLLRARGKGPCDRHGAEMHYELASSHRLLPGVSKGYTSNSNQHWKRGNVAVGSFSTGTRPLGCPAMSVVPPKRK